MKYTMAEEQVRLTNGETDFKPKVVWLGTHDHSADEVQKMVRDARFGKNDTKASKGVEAVQEILKDAPMRSRKFTMHSGHSASETAQPKDCIREARVASQQSWWLVDVIAAELSDPM